MIFFFYITWITDITISFTMFNSTITIPSNLNISKSHFKFLWHFIKIQWVIKWRLKSLYAPILGVVVTLWYHDWKNWLIRLIKVINIGLHRTAHMLNMHYLVMILHRDMPSTRRWMSVSQLGFEPLWFACLMHSHRPRRRIQYWIQIKSYVFHVS
jgi:hypothetical protein